MKKTHEQDLARLRADLFNAKRAIELREDLLTMASHELKTPISTITTYIDLLGMQIDRLHDQELQNEISEVKGQLLNLTDLINQMLDLSRLRKGKIKYKKSMFDVAELVSEVATREQKSTTRHRIVVTSPQGEQVVYGDKGSISRVLINIISNAIKFSDDGDIYVSSVRESGEVRVSVQDHGPGISAENLTKVFERFHQLPESGQMKSSQHGLGIGLYIASEIIKDHGGRIWCESVVGQGSTFHFTLPSKQPAPGVDFVMESLQL